MTIQHVHHFLSTVTSSAAHVVTGPSEDIQILDSRLYLGDGFTAYSGSFNPLHYGHTSLYRLATQHRLTENPPFWEVSLRRRGKTDLNAEELQAIYEQFYTPVLLTNACLYREKIQAIEKIVGTTPIHFEIGDDVLLRLMEDHSVEELVGYQATFRVWERTLSRECLGSKITGLNSAHQGKGNFLLAPEIPSALWDRTSQISSTQIREQRADNWGQHSWSGRKIR